MPKTTMATSVTASTNKSKKKAAATVPSFGFQKGFLLSPSRKKKKKPANRERIPLSKPISGALLDFEGEQAPISTRDKLLLVSINDENDPQYQKDSHFSLLENFGGDEHEHDDSSIQSPVHLTNEQGKPMIQELTSSPPITSSSKLESSPVSSITKRKVAMDDFVTDQGMSSIKALTGGDNKIMDAIERESSPPPWMIQKEDEDKDLDPSLSNTTTSLLVLSKELSKALITRQNRRAGGNYAQFVSNHLATSNSASWLYVWPQVLKKIVTAAQQQGKQNNAIEMGVAMLTMTADAGSEGITTLGHVMQSDSDKRVLLGVTLLIIHVMRQQNELYTIQQQQRLIDVLLPQLVQIVERSCDQRSVLAQESMVAAYGLLSTIGDTEDDGTVQALYSPLLHTLLQTHNKWLSQKKTKEGNWRNECTKAVLADWQALLAGGKWPSNHSKSGLVDPIDNLGSIRQSLFDPQPLTAIAVASVLDSVIEHQGAGAEQRPTLRGLLAVFGHDKHLWRDLDYHSKFVTKLLTILLVRKDDSDEGASDERGLCSSLLVFLLQAASSIPERLHEIIGIVIDGLEANPGLASRIGEPWSNALLVSTTVDDDRYAAVLEAICNTMFASPQQMAPLSLFGSMVNANVGWTTSSTLRHHRTTNGILAVITICTERMVEIQCIRTNISDVVYQRLAPLLLLRRISSKFYQDIWKKELETSTELQLALTALANRLATMMLPGDGTKNTSPEERKLAAEIAGLCLSFSLDAPYSAFTTIVRPAFQSFSLSIMTQDESGVLPYRAANGALYTACCQIPLGDEPALLAVSSFCLWLLQNEDDNERLAECQAGCVEFFATCLKSDRAGKICSALKQVLCDQPVKWLDLSLFDSSTTMTQIDLKSPLLKSCLWTSYSLASQRMPKEDDMLVNWARRTAPWVLDWLESHQTIGVAAALQILFILITRTRSLDCCIGDDHLLRRVNQSVTRNLQNRDAATRLGALELLLSIVTLDVEAYQALGKEADDTLLVVGVVAARDPEFQKLACHLLVGQQ